MRKEKIPLKFQLLFPAILMFISFMLMDFIKAKQISMEEITTYLENQGCEVIREKDSTFTTRLETSKDDSCPYFVQYFLIPNKSIRNSTYQEKKGIVRDNPNEDFAKSLDYNGSNYQEYYTEGDFYKTVINYKDSILMIETEVSNKEKVLLLQKNFGYYKENTCKLFLVLFAMAAILAIAIIFLDIKRREKE